MDELILPIYNELLIKEIKKHPCIYDMKCEDYKNTVVKANTWESVAKNLSGKAWNEIDHNNRATYMQQLQRRWKSLRDCYGRSLRTAITDKRKKQRRPYVYAKQMRFLLPFLEHMEKEKLDVIVKRSLEDMLGDGAVDSFMTQTLPKTKQCKMDSKDSTPSKSAKREEVSHPENNYSEDVQEWEFHTVPNTAYRDEDPEKLFLLSLLPSLKSVKLVDRLNVQIELMQVLNKWIQSYNSSVSTTVHSSIVPEISLEIDELSSS